MEPMEKPVKDTQLLTRYKAWANEVFLSFVATLPDAELTAPRPIVFGSLIRTLNHVHAMDHVWQCHLLGRPHGLTTRNPEHCPSMDELAVQQRRMDEWYATYVDTLSESALAEPVEFEFIGGGTGCLTRAEILLHVVNHATYHRGHAAGILYHLNVSPPTTDLPVFLRRERHVLSGN